MSAFGWCTCTAVYKGRGIACQKTYHRDDYGTLIGKCEALLDGVGYVEWDDANRDAVLAPFDPKVAAAFNRRNPKPSVSSGEAKE